MALKDIFTMIKADRYTADGCEEIKKAQKEIKEETADAGLPDGTMRHRKDGDYIKQAGKWVPAKRANGGAKKAEEKPESAPAANKADYNTAHAQLTKLKATSPELQNDFEDHRDIVLKRVERGQPLNEAFETYEKEMKASVPRMVEQDIMSKEEGDRYIKAWEDFKKQATSESKPDTSKEIAEHREAAQYYRRKASSFYETDPSYNTYLQKAREYEDKANELAGIPSHRGMTAEDYDKKLRAEGWRGDWEGDGSRAFGYFKKDGRTIRVSQNGTDGSIGDVVEIKQKVGDSAPRQLTGDCKVRIKKS